MAPKRRKQSLNAMTLQTVKDELASASELVTAQVEAGLSRDDTMEFLFSSSKAALSNLGAMTRQELTDVIKLCNTGPWSDDQKKELASIVSARMGDCLASEPSHMHTRAMQYCPYFENFVPEEKWADIRSAKQSVLSRAQILASVAKAINLVNPNEQTLFRMVSILAWVCENYDFSQEDVFGYMKKYKRSLNLLKTLPSTCRTSKITLRAPRTSQIS
jgi:hypothetical protein